MGEYGSYKGILLFSEFLAYISTANALFEIIGDDRVPDIQNFRLVVTARFDMTGPYAQKFFRSLESAKALNRLELEVGVIAYKSVPEPPQYVSRPEWDFFVKLN